MEATLKGREARVESVLDDLHTILGAEHVSAGPAARVDSIWDMTTPFDALESCEWTAYYHGTNID